MAYSGKSSYKQNKYTPVYSTTTTFVKAKNPDKVIIDYGNVLERDYSGGMTYDDIPLPVDTTPSIPQYTGGNRGFVTVSTIPRSSKSYSTAVENGYTRSEGYAVAGTNDAPYYTPDISSQYAAVDPNILYTSYDGYTYDYTTGAPVETNGTATAAPTSQPSFDGAAIGYIYDTATATQNDYTGSVKMKKRKVPGPLERKEKKTKMSHRVKRMLCPRNALFTLNELKTHEKTDFEVTGAQGNFYASMILKSVKYEGRGKTKTEAKTMAAENALRGLVIPQKEKYTTPVPEEAEGEEEDELSIVSLAAYALHKLLNEWDRNSAGKAAGTPVRTEYYQAVTPSTSTENGVRTLVPKLVKGRQDLPLDASVRNPASLLTFMRPYTKYEDLAASPHPQTIPEFVVGVNVDGISFAGKGKSKKIARKFAAMEACKTLWNVQFDPKVLTNY